MYQCITFNNGVHNTVTYHYSFLVIDNKICPQAYFCVVYTMEMEARQAFKKNCRGSPSLKFKEHKSKLFNCLVWSNFLSKLHDELTCLERALNLNLKNCRQYIQDIRRKNEAQCHENEMTGHLFSYWMILWNFAIRMFLPLVASRQFGKHLELGRNRDWY